MTGVPEKVAERLVAGITRFQPILAAANARGVAGNDTLTIIKDMLAEVFCYRAVDAKAPAPGPDSLCGDSAVELDAVLRTLIEVKPVSIELSDVDARRAGDCAARQGMDWVLLTNGITWRIYRLACARPAPPELVIDMDFFALNPGSERDIELLYLIQRGLAALIPWRIAGSETGGDCMPGRAMA